MLMPCKEAPSYTSKGVYGPYNCKVKCLRSGGQKVAVPKVLPCITLTHRPDFRSLCRCGLAAPVAVDPVNQCFGVQVQQVSIFDLLGNRVI